MFPYLSHNKRAAHRSLKGCIQSVWNEILNIKPYMVQISGTWELLLHEYWRKNMTFSERIPTHKD